MASESRTFVDLMALQAIGPDTYMSKCASFVPGGWGAAYGGHVFAQSAWAASQTVQEGMVMHNIHGYFTLPGFADRPYIYQIEHLSEGKTYCTRSITVRQPLIPSNMSSSPLPVHPPTRSSTQFHINDSKKELGKICFASICSFKKSEAREICHQEEKDLLSQYHVVLDGKKPSDHPHAPGVDAPWFLEYAKRFPPSTSFPGLNSRKVNMDLYNHGKSPMDYRQLTLYHLRGRIPLDKPNLHATAHLYASDRNSLFLVSSALGFPDNVEKMGSLSHSVVFHVDAENLLLRDDEDGVGDEGGWWTQEAWTARSGGGRGMHESRIWRADGLHVASSWQEGLVRRSRGEGSGQRDWYFNAAKASL